MKKIRLAIFASGTGSNALNIIQYFKTSDVVEIGFVLSNKQDAKIVNAAREQGVEVVVVSNQEVEAAGKLVDLCRENAIDYIILAGFLRKIPEQLIGLYPDRIINIHPSLLPKYGGKGMYGANVHKAVLENKEKVSGITIHFVNTEFDKGEIIAQFQCVVDEGETLESLQHKIHLLEHANFPNVIKNTIVS
ncbi:phosphoribosylglycinamide formyltransferase [Crocinitomicaceae bacterium CZZ-1]|uniref:Phosphoribosylglycinamide formyltransferase n=1 Tax=Taishania pollutisoli TaxID=2766479 RepID=A0A8J6PGG5_9FLAO|nr:phosphoribosylglycinamide formyltransferase [Taishania pollutisoli]MBC9811271.1 phosphoribosylglycinamide formyltransferase [Taishania pollutisoli]MBX2947814.1 phosphoribosylglycinamide formyltransferase [Crocinitomicaceae bacterium]